MKAPRSLDKALFQKLVAGDWIERHQNLLIIGQAGTGKSFIACTSHKRRCGIPIDARVRQTTNLMISSFSDPEYL